MEISFKNFPYGLFFALLVLNFTPALYDTFRLFLLNSENPEGYHIAGHIEWFDLFHEVLLTTFTVPFYFIFSKFKDSAKFNRVLKTILLVAICTYGLFFIGINLSLPNLLHTMSVTENTRAILTYLRLESVHFYFQFLYNVLLILFIIVGKAFIFYLFTGLRILGFIIGDFLFIPIYGVNGIAYSNLITTFLLCSLSFILLLKYFKPYRITFKLDFSWILLWGKLAFPTVLQIILSNFMYLFMVMGMITTLSSQGDYWAANNFIWGILLIPMFTLAEIIKRTAFQINNPYFFYYPTLWISLILILTIVMWPLFFQYVYNFPEETAYTIFEITLKLFPFYLVYYFGYVAESYLIGIGKIHYLLISSLIVNLIYYPFMWMLLHFEIFEISMNFVICLFGFGIIISSIITTFFFNKTIRIQIFE